MSTATTQELTIFRVGGIACALDIVDVYEISQNFAITEVPGSPEHVRGVINLRGLIVTVIDLKRKFGLGSVEIGPSTRNIVVKYGGESIGLLVDAIEDIREVNRLDIDGVPGNVGNVEGDFFSAIYKRDEELIAILALSRVLEKDSE